MTARAAILCVACLALGWAALGCSHDKTANQPNQPCCTARITGKVKSTGGSPLDSALVGFNFVPGTSPPFAFSGTTDGGGNYTIDLDWPQSYESPPGRVNLVRLVSRAGYRTDTAFVQVTMATNAQPDVILPPSPQAP